MKSSLLKSVNRLMLLFVVAFTLINSNKSDAQPYCTANYTTGTIYWYDFFGYIARFSMQKSTSTGIDDYARNATPVDPIPPANLGTGMEQYKHTKNPVVQMKIGNTYQFKLNVHGWGSQYTRLFIDLNGDGDFNDVVNGVNEFRGTLFNNFPFTYNFSLPYPEYYVKTNRVVTFTGINIPCNAVPITGSRIRVMTAYGVNNGADACSNGYNYQLQFGYNLWYGEVEDYDMDIVPDAPQSFPTDESILYAKESYDGTQRQRNGSGPLINFPKPNMTFVGGAPTGTTLQMSIRGPLPSTNTVWTALEPGTNNSTITVTNAIPAGGSFIPSNSTGFVDEDGNRYSPGNNGSVKFWEGGEYQLVIAVGGAGCPGSVIRNFTAALDYDLAAKGIVSPRTNLAPSFLKYQNNS
ncbi:MAG: GEVED domain-containing protein, partial [Candidatus Kapaibacteriota bacterium]